MAGVSSLGAGDPDSLAAANSVTAPLAAGTVVTLAAPPAGVYDITFSYFLSGTAETALANIRLRKATTNLVNLCPTISAGPVVTVRMPRVTLDGVSALFIQAIAAATAGAQYSGTIVVTRVA